MTQPFRLLLGALLCALLLGCSVIDGSDGKGDAVVRGAVLAVQVNDRGEPVSPTRVFAPNVPQIISVVSLENVESGADVSGRWFQLNVQDVPPDGLEILKSDVKLAEDNVKEGRSIVRFTLPGKAQGLPEDAYLLRVYVNGDVVRTMGFVVAGAGGASAPAPAPSPAPPTTPGVTATPAFTSYTVVSGDTLQSIATRFKPANEDLTAFQGRIAQANNISTSATLQPGQVLRIPR
jgi:hypothetical protein